MKAPTPLELDLVLVGGGHAHALVLRKLAMRPLAAGTRITLISPDSHTPYSGMLPGMVAGHYTFSETHIDLARLCQWAQVRFITAAVDGIDPAARLVSVPGRPALRYDVLSLDIGSQPDLDSVPGAREYAVPVKPVAELWQRWQQFAGQKSMHSHRVGIVGGGAGGVELALAMAHALRDRSVQISLFCGSAVLSGYNAISRRAAARALMAAGVQVHAGSRVVELRKDAVVLDSGATHASDTVFWCTAAAPAPWVAASGLATDERGFLLVRDSLQSVDEPRVFAAGDIATQQNHPRPKAGVYAVRQAPTLAANLETALDTLAPSSGSNAEAIRGLKNHHPQRRFLSLVSLGGRRATADRGIWGATGNWVWRWKDQIDRKFMRRFSELPPRKPMAPRSADSSEQPPCGGCGAKVGNDPLRAALSTLRADYPQHALPDGDAGEDVAVVPCAGQMLQSIDSLRMLLADPYRMGKIAAQHALSDLYAAGATPVSALAHLVLPYARPSLQQSDLEQVLAGALAVFAKANCVLRGGHTLQGPEWQVGFVVNGTVDAAKRRYTGGAQTGDQLLLTKPLGTGVIFAAHMQLLADGRDVNAAVQSMEMSNAAASRIASEHAATAATDVTGFGLLGHLAPMLGTSLDAQLQLSAVPVLPGALAAAKLQVRSTLWPANRAAVHGQVQGLSKPGTDPAQDLLCDPQTSGGLLLSIPSARAAACLDALQGHGHEAAIIGSVHGAGSGKIQLRA